MPFRFVCILYLFPVLFATLTSCSVIVIKVLFVSFSGDCAFLDRLINYVRVLPGEKTKFTSVQHTNDWKEEHNVCEILVDGLFNQVVQPHACKGEINKTMINTLFLNVINLHNCAPTKYLRVG